jgi:hypothetical protein
MYSDEEAEMRINAIELHIGYFQAVFKIVETQNYLKNRSWINGTSESVIAEIRQS